MRVKYTYQNYWDAAKAVLRGKLIVVYIYFKEEKNISNNLTLYFRELEKEEQTKSKVSRKREIIKIRVETNEIENRKNQQNSEMAF